MTPRNEEAMFAMICTDNLRYKRTKYYDSEYIIKGTLHINEHAYAFSHYEGAFEVLGIRWLSNYTKGRYSKDTGLEFSIGADTEEGRLLQEHKDEAIECILQTVHELHGDLSVFRDPVPGIPR